MSSPREYPFFAPITHLAWNPNGAKEFVSASHEHAIRAWKVVVGDDKSKDNDGGHGADTAAAVVSVRLDWSSDSNSLVGIGAITTEAKGLSAFDRTLLKQRESAKENKLIGEYDLVE
ncbi:hypothetical protein BGZ96_007778 [Linnemannia gamsii]|uniref:Anaphase-promoting complex subunit 4 WD40 domain-containing protein n=1 Tax=Linnemannia gamsii TaxID=64522 RepID=A0ABQ7KDH7_9FUNG|nr:hypothetical protein BGZ96_007778 [Linnemannia gamsii]